MKYINGKTSVKFLALFFFFAGLEMLAQSTILKLPTIDNTSSFNITKSDSTNIFRLFGDGGFYVGGTFGTGTIPTEGPGARLMWFPGNSAFRVGSVIGAHWDNSNIGQYSVAIGTNTLASAFSSIAMGYFTTASGVYSTALGSHSISSGIYSTAMGIYTTASGYGSTAIGSHTTSSGDYSTAIGSYVNTLSKTGSLIIGDYSTNGVYTNSSGDNQMTMRFAGGYRLFTNSASNIGAYLTPNSNSWTAVSDSTKKENFVNADGEYFLNSLSKLKLGSWNYKTQDSKEYRHYGPMAQEIFHYFGKDEIGTIGNDTTLATADMDGIMMIMLQALEKRTAELQNAEERISRLENELLQQNKNISEQQNLFEDLRNELLDTKKIISTIYKEKYSSEDKTLIINQEN